MKIIGIDGVPLKSNIKHATTIVSKFIHVNFESLNFGESDKPGRKVLYINILDNVDNMKCVRDISGKIWAGSKLHAFVPNKLPYMNLDKNPKKEVAHQLGGVKNRKKGSKRPRKAMPPDQIVIMTRNLIMYEMQDWFTGLADINETTEHKLYFELANIIKERLQALISDKDIVSCFELSGQYRWQYPHDTDYGLIVTALQRAGSEIQLNKEMLKPYPPPYEPSMIDNLPIKKVQDACKKYAKMITTEITKHINSLETDVQGTTQNVDQAARYKVREQLQKLAPCVPALVSESLMKHFMPVKNYTLLRVYGIPCLPKVDMMKPFMRKYNANHFRSPYLYNCLQVQVPNEKVPAILAADDTVIDGRRLVVRTFTRDVYRKIVKEITLMESGQTLDFTLEEEDDVQMENEEAWENWEEEK